jgi:hypothetical protein
MASMHARLAILSAAVGAALAGCGEPATSFSFAHGAVRVRGSDVTILRGGAPDAHLSADGSLTIGSGPVTLTPEQRAQIQSYHSAALAIRSDALATGKAGAEVGAAAAKEAVSGLLHGDTSQIGARVEAKAKEVKRQALGLCNDLATVRSAQQSLRSTLAAFEPYAVVQEAEVSDCAREFKDAKAAG